MVKTASTMLPLGSTLPNFSLTNVVDGKTVSTSSLTPGPLLVAFICNHCPFVIHIRDQFVRFADDYQRQGLKVVAISSNDIANYPQDGPDKMQQEAQNFGYTFPYLFDDTQQVAKDFHAACTPDFFLFDRHAKLVYRGQFDDSRPNSGIPVTGADLKAACDSVLAGQPVREGQKPSIGCNIKWKPGNEPTYFTGQAAH